MVQLVLIVDEALLRIILLNQPVLKGQLDKEDKYAGKMVVPSHYICPDYNCRSGTSYRKG